MGKIRVKQIDPDQAEKEDKGKEKGKKKSVRVPGLKGGERVKAMEGVIIEEDFPQAEPASEEEAETSEKGAKETKEAKKARKAKVRSKKYKQAAKLIDKNKGYSPKEALELVKKTALASFDGQVQVHLNLAPRLKGSKFSLTLPHPTGKKTIVLAFGKDAKKAGADLQGGEKTIEKIKEGFKNFTVIVATPEWMPKLAPAAKFLGPRGLMPSPKTGTIAEDLKEIIQKLKSSKMILATEKKAPLIHTVIGPVSWPTKKLQENLIALIKAIGDNKIKKLTLAATMGPGVKVAFNQD